MNHPDGKYGLTSNIWIGIAMTELIGEGSVYVSGDIERFILIFEEACDIFAQLAYNGDFAICKCGSNGSSVSDG